MYNLQKPDGGITEMITYVNDYLSGEANFLSEESNYPDSATKMGPGRATKLGRKNCEGVPAMYTFQKPDGGITEMITYVNGYLSGESLFLSEESNNNIADATQMSMDKTEELTSRESREEFSEYRPTQGQVKQAIIMAKQPNLDGNGIPDAISTTKGAKDLSWLANDGARSVPRARHPLRLCPILQQRKASNKIAMCESPTNKRPTKFLIKRFACDKNKKRAMHANDSTSYVIK